MATIMHVDMDAFFAAVEILDNPEYAGKPLIIGGYKDSRRGVVSTCSYEARKYGVRSAMPIAQAVALCPHGIFIPGRMARYREVSEKIHAIFPEFSPVVEPLSIDEAFLDMTGCEHFYPDLETMALSLKRRIKEETGLTASVGVAPNKFLAKLASDRNKPDGLCVIRPEEVEEFLRDLPVGKLWGVGKKSEQELNKLGIFYVRDLLTYSLQELEAKFGTAFGHHLYNLARGNDDRKVEPVHEAKSIGHEITFEEDVTSLAILKSQLGRLVEDVGWRLRRHNLYARTVTLKLRYYNFKTITRSQTHVTAFCDDDTIFDTAFQLLEREKLQPVRLLGVTVSNLTDAVQLSLFHDEESSHRLSQVMDKINARFRRGAITKGRTLLNEDSQ